MDARITDTATDAKTSTALVPYIPPSVLFRGTRTPISASPKPQPVLTDAEVQVLKNPLPNWSDADKDLQFIRTYLITATIALPLRPDLINREILNKIASYLAYARGREDAIKLTLTLLQSPLSQCVSPRNLLDFYLEAIRGNAALLKILSDPIEHQLFSEVYLTYIASKYSDIDRFLLINNDNLRELWARQIAVLINYHQRQELSQKTEEEKTKGDAKKAADAKEQLLEKKLRKEIESFYARFIKEKANSPGEYKEAETIFKKFLPHQDEDSNQEEISRMAVSELNKMDTELKKSYPHYPLKKHEWDILTKSDVSKPKTYVDAAIQARAYLVSETIPGDPYNAQVIRRVDLRRAALADAKTALTVLSTTLAKAPLEAEDIVEIYQKYLNDDQFFKDCLETKTAHRISFKALLPYLLFQTPVKTLSLYPRNRLAQLFCFQLKFFYSIHQDYRPKIDNEVERLVKHKRNTGEDPWTLLGVTENADQKAIGKAFAKFSLNWHPDKNSDGKEKFLLAVTARTVLCDPGLKEQYLNEAAKKSSDEKDTAAQSLSYCPLINAYIKKLKAFFAAEGMKDDLGISPDASFNVIHAKEKKLRSHFRELICCFLFTKPAFFPSSKKFKELLGYPEGPLPSLDSLRSTKTEIINEFKNTIINNFKNDKTIESIKKTIDTIESLQHAVKTDFYRFKIDQYTILELSKTLETAKKLEKEYEARKAVEDFVDSYKDSLPSYQKFKQQCDSKDPQPSAEIQKTVTAELRAKTLQDFPKVCAADIKEAIADIKRNWLSSYFYSDPNYITELDNILKAIHAVCGWDNPLDPIKHMSFLNPLIKILFTNIELNNALQLPNHGKLKTLQEKFPKLCQVPKEVLERSLAREDGILFLHIDRYSENAVKYKTFFDAIEFLPKNNIEMFLRLLHK